MSFQEPPFLIFFPILYVLYLAVRSGEAKNRILLIASVLFYTWGEPAFVPVLLVSMLIDYKLSQAMVAAAPRTRQTLLTIGVAGNLLLLGFYKYTDFLFANVNVLLAPFTPERLPLLQIALPIGVSFVVFEKITYLVDTYRGTSKPAPRLIDYALFVFLFPKLLAGPILKYHEMSAQIANPRQPEWEDFWQGLLRLSRGLAKKVLIADTVATFTDLAFGADPGTLSTSYAWLGLLCFTIQIYFDFSGYSDMAIGLARMFGYKLRENFNKPYTSQTITEFWQRWHISLTTFIRDYLYVALGRNRNGPLRHYINLWICFLASGLWHGASWNFVLWGAYNGLFLTLDKLFFSKLMRRSGRLVATTVTLGLVMFGYVIFRTTTLAHFTGYIAAMAGFTNGTPNFDVPGDTALALIVGVVVSLLPATPLWDPLLRAYKTRAFPYAAANTVLLGLYVLSLARAMATPFKPFIYFRF